MAMPAWVPQAWAKLSEENQKQASDYLKLLLSEQGAGETKEVKPFQFGVLKGQIEVFDNFDDPLPCFKEYM